MAAWQRPEDVPLPSEWSRFKGARAMPDGRTPTFWIQDATPQYYEEIVDFMCDSFLKEEIFCSSCGIRDDPLALEEIRVLWRDILKQRVALLALTDWPDGPDHPRLAGCNVTCVTLRGEHLPEMSSPKLQRVLQGLHHVEDKVDVYEHFGVDAALNALGLSVAPAFRGQGLGRELLLARTPLGRALGLRVTVTVFTGVASQKESARAGFHVLAEQNYDDYKENGQVVFPDAPPGGVFQYKGKRLDEDQKA